MTTSLRVISGERFHSLYIVFALNLLALSAALLWDGSDQDVLIPIIRSWCIKLPGGRGYSASDLGKSEPLRI